MANENTLEKIERMIKALEAGNYDAQPSRLVQGSALQREDCSSVMNNVTFTEKQIKLQKDIRTESCKSTLAQFNRQLSYGVFGGSAQLEGAVGNEETSEFVRITVPMCFYSHVRRVTLAADMVDTQDSKAASARAAEDAAIKLAADIEFDLFRGKADFSNGGVFDGHPALIPIMPNILGLDVQIRQSDAQRNAQDLMFGEYGSDDSVVIPGGGTLTQEMILDASVRSSMNMGSADKLYVDPIVLKNYNKIALGKERIVLAGSPQTATGADLKRQWVNGDTVSLEASRFLSGKSRPQAPRSNGPLAPSVLALASVAVTSPTAFTAGQQYTYIVTSGNEIGESARIAPQTVTVGTNGDGIQVTITPPGSGIVRWFNVYRTGVGGAAATAKYIGRVAYSGGATQVFMDLGNKIPGFVTGYLLQSDTYEIRELSPYSKLKLALTDLSEPEAHFRFLTLAVMHPRKNVLIDNLR